MLRRAHDTCRQPEVKVPCPPRPEGTWTERDREVLGKIDEAVIHMADGILKVDLQRGTQPQTPLPAMAEALARLLDARTAAKRH